MKPYLTDTLTPPLSLEFQLKFMEKLGKHMVSLQLVTSHQLFDNVQSLISQRPRVHSHLKADVLVAHLKWCPSAVRSCPQWQATPGTLINWWSPRLLCFSLGGLSVTGLESMDYTCVVSVGQIQLESWPGGFMLESWHLLADDRWFTMQNLDQTVSTGSSTHKLPVTI